MNVEQSNTPDLLPFEKLNKLTDTLPGAIKWIVKKILNSDFTNEVKKTLSDDNSQTTDYVLKKLEESVKTAIRTILRGIVLKVTIILTLLVTVFAVLAVVATLALGGNALVPILVSLLPIAIIWIVAGIAATLVVTAATNLLTRKISVILLKLVENSRGK